MKERQKILIDNAKKTKMKYAKDLMIINLDCSYGADMSRRNKSIMMRKSRI